MKSYLDELGVERLKQYFDAQIAALDEKIALLNKKDGTPGSIQQIVNDTIANTSISDLKQDEETIIYGGSASENINEGA